MKKSFKILSVLFLSFSFFCCNTENESLENLQGESLTFDALFEKVSRMNIEVNDENVIYIYYTWDKSTGLLQVTKTSEREPDFFILEDTSAGKILGDRFKVTCDNGGDGSNNWTKTCDGKFSCGKLLYDCVNGGGCGTICNNKMAYAPQTKTFYLLKE